MPADSIYNQQMKAADEMVIEEPAAVTIKDTEKYRTSINSDNQYAASS